MNDEEITIWFRSVRDVLENSYQFHPEPWKGSGMSGPGERWTTLRKPVADCVETSGTFLDIGCANGYLLECLMKWTGERGITIEPYGLDISSRLVDLAAKRLPKYTANFFVGNSYYWIPPMRFDYVRTELVYVPGEHERQYLNHLLENYLNPGGKLLVANYLEKHPQTASKLFPGNHPTRFILERLGNLGFEVMNFRDSYDSVKDRHIRIAILAT